MLAACLFWVPLTCPWFEGVHSRLQARSRSARGSTTRKHIQELQLPLHTTMLEQARPMMLYIAATKAAAAAGSAAVEYANATAENRMREFVKEHSALVSNSAAYGCLEVSGRT